MAVLTNWTESDAPLDATPGIPDDDVRDPIVPPAALESLPALTLQQVRDDLRAMARATDLSMDRLPGLLDKQHAALAQLLETHRQSLSASEAGVLQHLCDCLETLGARGVVVSGAPYSAAIQSISPAGYPLTLRIERQDGAAFFEAVAGMESWLKTAGYTVPPAALAF